MAKTTQTNTGGRAFLITFVLCVAILSLIPTYQDAIENQPFLNWLRFKSLEDFGMKAGAMIIPSLFVAFLVAEIDEV